MRNRRSSYLQGPADILAGFGVLMVVAIIMGFVLWSIRASNTVPAKYQTGAWLQAGDEWVAKNKMATLEVSPDPDRESARTLVRVNNFKKYWFEVQLPNRSFEPIKERNQATIAVATDSIRVIRLYDRKTGKLVSTNVIGFQIKP